MPEVPDIYVEHVRERTAALAEQVGRLAGADAHELWGALGLEAIDIGLVIRDAAAWRSVGVPDTEKDSQMNEPKWRTPRTMRDADVIEFEKGQPIVDHVAEHLRDPEHGIRDLMHERAQLEQKIADLEYELTKHRYRCRCGAADS